MIRTRRLVLRPARADDLMALHEIFSDPRAMRYWDRLPHEDIGETGNFLDAFMTADAAGREEYIIEFGGRCIGKAGCWKKPELGYILHPEFWGQGLATEAIRPILPRAFDKFADVDALTAEIDPRNAASERVLRKLGFEKVGAAERTFCIGGEWSDSAFFELSRSRCQSAGDSR